MNEHTQGILVTGGTMPTNIFALNGLRVARCDFDGDETNPEAQANARRFVDCWNACAGMADPAAEITAMRAQRDELLARL